MPDTTASLTRLLRKAPQPPHPAPSWLQPGPGARLNDLWAFDPCTGRWQQLTGSGTLPSPRQGAAACEAGGLLWVMGGQANFVLDDLFTFDLAKKVVHCMIQGLDPGCGSPGASLLPACLPASLPTNCRCHTSA